MPESITFLLQYLELNYLLFSCSIQFSTYYSIPHLCMFTKSFFSYIQMKPFHFLCVICNLSSRNWCYDLSNVNIIISIRNSLMIQTIACFCCFARPFIDSGGIHDTTKLSSWEGEKGIRALLNFPSMSHTLCVLLVPLRFVFFFVCSTKCF